MRGAHATGACRGRGEVMLSSSTTKVDRSSGYAFEQINNSTGAGITLYLHHDQQKVNTPPGRLHRHRHRQMHLHPYGTPSAICGWITAQLAAANGLDGKDVGATGS
jgi:hypothetical protein